MKVEGTAWHSGYYKLLCNSAKMLDDPRLAVSNNEEYFSVP